MSTNHKKYLIAAFSILFPLFLIPHCVNPDFWFLLNDGRYVMEHGFPHTDPFSLHENLHFVMQQWLSAVIFWNVWHFFGESGISVLVAFVGLLTLLAFYRLCFLVSKKNHLAASLVTVLVGMLAIHIFFHVRPQIFSTFFLLLSVLCMEQHQQTGNMKYLFPLPVFSALLSNLHAAIWPMVLVFMLPFLMASLPCKIISKFSISGNPQCLKPLLFSVPLVLLAGLFNPYGMEAVTYTMHSYGIDVINENIVEMFPLTFGNATGNFFLPILAATLILCSRIKMKLQYLLLSIGCMYMAMKTCRSVFFFLMMGTLPFSFALSQLRLPEIKKQDTSPAILRRHLLMIAGLLAILSLQLWKNMEKLADIDPPMQVLFGIIAIATLFLLLIPSKRLSFLSMENLRNKAAVLLVSLSFLTFFLAGHKNDTSQYLPEGKEGIDYLAAHFSPDEVRLWTDFVEGSYAGFVGFHPYIDSRAEVFLKALNHQKDILQEYSNLINGWIYYKDFLDSYQFTHLLTKEGSYIDNCLLHDSNYEILYEYDAHSEDSTVTHCRLFAKKSKG